MDRDFRLEGRNALITGGGSGIGFGIAEKMVRAGARVVITGRSEEKLEQARERLGSSCLVIRNDITLKKEIPGMVRQAEEEAGPIDVLVNNAGIHLKKPTLDVSEEEFESVLDINLRSVFELTREVLRFMIPRQRGSVIFISSMAALYGVPYVAAYTSSKSAIVGLTRALASEYSSTGIRFNAIAPGFIETPLFEKAVRDDPARLNRILARTPMGRLGRRSDIGNAAVFLASDASGFITGTCLPVDGGNSIGF